MFFSKQNGAFSPAMDAAEQQLQAPPTPPGGNGGRSPPPQFDSLEHEAETLSEVEERIIKANYYRAILNQPLFGNDDSDIAYDVEREFRDFALERLRILLGLQAEKVIEEKAFTYDQEDVLREWADRLMAKPQLLGVVGTGQPQVAIAQVRQPQQAPAQPKQQPQVNPVSAPQAPARKRGRPPGSRNRQTSDTVPDVRKPQQATAGLSKEEIEAGLKVDEQGQKYFEQPGHDIVTGQPKMIKMLVGGAQLPTNDPNYKQMPPADSDISIMREQAEAGMMHNKAVNLHPKMGEILNHFMTKE